MANAGFGCSDLILTVALVLALWVPTEMLSASGTKRLSRPAKRQNHFPAEMFYRAAA
jgi:hypothetical protein